MYMQLKYFRACDTIIFHSVIHSSGTSTKVCKGTAKKSTATNQLVDNKFSPAGCFY